MVDKDSGKGAREVIKGLSTSMDIKAFNRLQQVNNIIHYLYQAIQKQLNVLFSNKNISQFHLVEI